MLPDVASFVADTSPDSIPPSALSESAVLLNSDAKAEAYIVASQIGAAVFKKTSASQLQNSFSAL